ncbi:MAG TPA: hypothetical protein VL095_14810 [Flavisolibacter sp.]|nr:hypothetical protein [Flavisolibacter sp.]
MKRIILIAIVLIIAIGGWYVYKLYQQKTPDVVNQTPDVTATATELLNAFTNDTAAARKQYVDKVVEVTGNVKRIDTTGSIVLGEEGNASEITVGLDRRHLKDYEKLKVGSTAIVQGICTGSTNESNNTDPTDLFAALGATVELRSAGVKEKK